MENVLFTKSKSTQKVENRGSKRGGFGENIVLVFVVIAISGFLLYQTYKSISLTLQKLDIYSQAQDDVDTLRLKNLDLLLESNKVKTDYYVEAEGRDRLHLSKNDEFVFIISDELLESSELEAYYRGFFEVDGQLTYSAGLNGWIEFVLQGS